MRLFVPLFFAALSPLCAELDGWQTVRVPDEGGWVGEPGFGWYRACVKVPASWAGSRLLLMTGSVREVDEAFVNGEKVGANGAMPPLFGKPSSSIRRPFVIEPDQIRFGGHNLIAWRVYNSEGAGGILAGPVHLTRRDDAIDLSGTWLVRRGDAPAWADWQGDPQAETAAFLEMAGNEPAGHRGVIPADLEGRRRMLAAVHQHFEGNQNPYARADDKGDPTPAQEAVTKFELGDGLALDLVLSEPLVRQPLYLDFDERGRLWVVQYIQYPDPAGLEVLTWDQHLRKVFDQVPPPPPFVKPEHRKFIGKDKITIHEDTDGNGVYDKHSTFLDGLNMVTSLAHGNGGVWVLQPPYLLFYPDENDDDVPDGDPVVHLSGFNLEDTHSISNSLKFGPDGWLYGCTGSTVTARVRVHLDPNAPRHSFLGQNIWRYHPTGHQFELFAEGGWNNFGVDFDAKGRLYSGTNGTQQAVHFVQGGYYQKSFGKHGPHTNPYAFGHFSGMPVEGEKIRLVHQWLRYGSGAIPSLEGRWVGGNSLANKLHALRPEPHGSTFKAVEEENPLRTADKWFRPVHCTIGPDGAIYIADFYDARITHVDPRDNWDRSNGRVYRLRASDTQPRLPRLDGLAAAQLVEMLADPNQWTRQTARRLLAERNDQSVVPFLVTALTVQGNDSQNALEALWTLHALDRLDLGTLRTALANPDPHVRVWAVRLAADHGPDLVAQLLPELGALALKEPDPEVISQLVAATQRLPQVAGPLIASLADRGEFGGDPFIPQQLWWAVEALVTQAPEEAGKLLAYAGLWDSPLFQQVIRERIGRRYMAERSASSLAMCAFLLERAAGTGHLDPLIRGMEKALEGSSLDPVPPILDEAIANIWKTHRATDDVIRFSLRLKSPQALAAARPLVASRETPQPRRLAFLKALSELHDADSEALFLDLFRQESEDPEVRLAALSALRRYSDDAIPATILTAYPTLDGPLLQTAQSLLAGRPGWARRLLEAVDEGRVRPESVALDSLLLMQTYEDEKTGALLAKHWGELRKSPDAKAKRIVQIKKLLADPRETGDAGRGREVFAAYCASCHKFGDQGRDIGPDLTGYEMDNLDYLVPAIVDPNLGIREGFELATVTLRARGDAPPAVLSGFLTDSNARTLTLKDLAGNLTVLARADVANESRAPVSVMPEGLLDALRDEQIRDLVAYLQAP